jgi:hypothetical protein
MQDAPDSSTPGSAPVEVGYYAQGTRPLLLLVRSIGVLAVVIAITRLIVLPFRFRVVMTQRWAGQLPSTGWFGFWSTMSLFMSLTLAVLMLIGGAGCLRKVPHGRPVLIGWAWATIVWAACAIAVNVSFVLGSGRAGLSVNEVVLTIGDQAEQWMGALVMPVIVLGLMRRAIVGDLLDEQER